MWLIPFLLLQAADSDSNESPHLAKNAFYRELREVGVEVAPDHQIKLPKPFLADGLDAAAQRKLIEELGGRRYRWDLLTRESVVAPQIILLSEERIPESDIKARIADVYFVAYGDFGAIAESGELTQPGSKGNQQWKPLSAEELAKRNITIDDAKHVSYGWISHDLIDRVKVSAALKTQWSQTDESLIATAALEPRFDGDAEFPNRWQPLIRGRKGMEPGEPRPYQGVGGYTKITRLKSPSGAFFVESHLVFAEPHAWFDGANLLGSKLPAAIQHEVRSTRREMIEVSRKKE